MLFRFLIWRFLELCAALPTAKASESYVFIDKEPALGIRAHERPPVHKQGWTGAVRRHFNKTILRKDALFWARRSWAGRMRHVLKKGHPNGHLELSKHSWIIQVVLSNQR